MKRILMQYALVLVCVALSGWALLSTSQQVQKARHELAAIEGDIAAEKTRMSVLDGEWSYLNSPARLEKLAREFLDIKPPSATDPAMVGKVSDIPFPAASQAENLSPEAAAYMPLQPLENREENDAR